MNKDSFLKPHVLIVSALVVGFIGGVLGGTIRNQGNPALAVPATIEKSYVEESQSVDAIKKVSPAVVSIIASRDLKVYSGQNSPFSQSGGIPGFPGFQFNIPQQNQPNSGNSNDYTVQKQQVAGGSGFIISADGLVLTNKHVVSEQNVDYSIIMNDGTEYDGEVVSVDPSYDLAVVQIVKKGELKKDKNSRTKLSNLPIVELGDSDASQVGQKVLAIGNALGEYQNTVTSGIISAKGRHIQAGGASSGRETLSGLLQTDAAINPGNSGGPLVSLDGQVVGINVAIDTTGSSIGFAIPINDVKTILDSVKKYGRIVRPSLGVRHIILNKAKANELQLPVDHGALLVGDDANGQFAVVPGSAADKAGLKMKDVILSVDDKDITTDYSLQESIRNHKPGDQITLKVWRSGQTITIKVTLDESKDVAAVPNASA